MKTEQQELLAKVCPKCWRALPKDYERCPDCNCLLIDVLPLGEGGTDGKKKPP